MSIEKRTGEGEAGVGEAWSGSILRMCDLDCRIIVFRRRFTSSVYFLHATPPSLSSPIIPWLLQAADCAACLLLPLLLPRIARISRVVCTSVGLLLLVSKLPPELKNSPLLLCASFSIMWIYTDACACVCVYVFAHECCACMLHMHKCVVLTYASGLAGFFRVQVCTCVHA